MKPVSAYPGHRKLVGGVPNPEEEGEDEGEEERGLESFMRRSAERAFTADVKRGEICAFVEGHADRVLQTEVTVQSVLEFVPGVRVAVAAEPDSLAEYERLVS